MLGIVFSLFSIFLLVFMLYKKINAHMALLLSGLLLLSLAAIFGLSPHIVAKGSLNLGFFDIFQVFNQTMSNTLAGLGLTLMTIAGFSAYMDHVGASYALFKVFEKPLKAVKSPYVLLIVAYFIVQFLVLFIRRNGQCRTDFADIQNKKECGGNRQWQNHYLRNWAANTKGKGII